MGAMVVATQQDEPRAGNKPQATQAIHWDDDYCIKACKLASSEAATHRGALQGCGQGKRHHQGRHRARG